MKFFKAKTFLFRIFTIKIFHDDVKMVLFLSFLVSRINNIREVKISNVYWYVYVNYRGIT